MKRESKLIILSVFVVLALMAAVYGVRAYTKSVSTEPELQGVYEPSSYINEDVLANLQDCRVDLCLEREYKPELIGEDADAIVIATVISLDGVDPTKGLFGMSNGKLLVDSTLKGNLKEGQVVEYVKNGGVMKMSEWEATQPEAATAKRQYLREQAGLELDLDNTYINIQILDDVEIEPGYTYLIYLKENNSKYEIIGLDVGLRKIDVGFSSKISVQALNIDELRVMNNKTGEFESLKDYINTYIK